MYTAHTPRVDSAGRRGDGELRPWHHTYMYTARVGIADSQTAWSQKTQREGARVPPKQRRAMDDVV